MEKAINTGDELIDLFFRYGRFGGFRSESLLEKGILVDSKVRSQILTSVGQGKTTIEGVVKVVNFESMGGGVYRAFVN